MKKVAENYFIDQEGNLWSTKRGPKHKMKYATDRWGYLGTYITIDGAPKYVQAHRLVAVAFIPNPDNLPEVDHIDGDTTNPRVENLRWCTAAQNNRYSVINGKQFNPLQGDDSPFSSHKESNIIEALMQVMQGKSISKAAKEIGMSSEGLRRVCIGDTRRSIWKLLGEEVEDYFRETYNWIEKGTSTKASQYSDEDLIKALQSISNGMSKAEAARTFGISINVIRHVCAGRSRTDIMEQLQKV